MRLKVSSAKWRPFCLGLNVLMACEHKYEYNDTTIPAPIAVSYRDVPWRKQVITHVYNIVLVLILWKQLVQSGNILELDVRILNIKFDTYIL